MKISFTIKCDTCGSQDISVSSSVNEFNHIDIWLICRDCKNAEEVRE